jgi:hypothetical protein
VSLPSSGRRGLVLGVCCSVLALTSTASADVLTDPTDQWLPSPAGATWTYEWSDASYAPTPTRESYSVASNSGSAFRLQWTTDGQPNPPGAVASAGQIDFQRTQAGLVNQSWAGTVPPSQFPILCGVANGCANSLSSTLYMAIWGSRSPTLLEPLLKGQEWSSVGGVDSDVASTNRYVGTQSLVVPAFAKPVRAAQVKSEITQGGALGDPYGSGERTVWWVRGVGPVRIVIRHAGGDVQQADLVQTSLVPKAPPADADYFPLKLGSTQTMRYRNSKHLKAWSTQRLKVGQVVNGTARVDVANVSGPIKVAGSYVFSKRLGGITNLSASTSAATRATFPTLGPIGKPKSARRHFFTPLDLATFGINPFLTAYPAKGQTVTATSRRSRDYAIYGVTGSERVAGFKEVTVPAGTFNALAVVSKLKQRGVPYGSGTRTSYFAAGKGLVELVFRHDDGSVSTVQRVK